MCFFHQWGKWAQYDVNIPAVQISKKWQLSQATDHMQKRQCEKCGTEERKKIVKLLLEIRKKNWDESLTKKNLPILINFINTLK